MLKNFSVGLLLISIGAGLFAAPPHSWDSKPDSYFWRVDKENKVRFLPPHDRGWKNADYKKPKVAPSRPIPRVAFGSGYDHPGYGSFDKVSIPLELLEESGYSRNQAEIRVGVPFPRYGIYSLKNMRVINPDKKEVPAQFSELSRWPDGSLRFVLVSFNAGLKANQKQIWHLEAGKKINSAKKRKSIQVKETADRFEINTLAITAEISKKDFQLPVNVKFRNSRTPASFKGITMVGADGKIYRTSGAPDRIVVEEKGTEHVTILSEGKLLPEGKYGSYRYQVRMRFRLHSPVVKMDIALINADLEYEFFDFKELYCELDPGFAPKNIAAGLGKKSIHSRAIRQMSWNSVQIGSQKQNGTLQSWFCLASRDPKTRLSLAIGDAAKLWPKGVSLADNKFRIELLPPLPDKNFGKDFPQQVAYCFLNGNHRQKFGMKFTTPLLVDFSGGSLPVLAAEADLPVVAVLPQKWYEFCKVFAGADATVPGVDHRINEMLKFNDISAKDDIETGYFNYGDWYGERKRNWGNNEYDTPYSYFSQFVRTGNRKLFRLALAGARHQADTDTVHASPNARILGGMPYHSIGHTGTADYTIAYWSPTRAGINGFPNNGHTWLRGMISAWTLAGDARCMDSALLCGEQLYRQSWMQTKMASAPRVTAWMLTALCALYEVKPDPAYVTGAKNIFEMQLREQDFEHGGIWARRKPRLGENVKGQTTFMLGVIGISHVEYHRLFQDPRAVKSLRYICDWFVGNFVPHEVGYWYDAEWNHKRHTFVVCFVGPYTGSVLTYTANLTGNKKYIDVSDQLLKMQLSRGFGVKKDMSISMLQLNEWLGYRKLWTLSHPQDQFTYDMDLWYKEYLARQKPAFQARSKEPIIFRLTLKKAQGEIELKRTQLNVREAEIRLSDAAGKVIFSTKTERDAKLNSWKIPFKGKVGDVLNLTISDNDNAFWDLPVNDAYFAEAKLTPLYILRRPNLRRYFFKVPAGTKNFTVKVFPRNTGFTSGLVRRPDGSIAGFNEGCNYSTAGKLPTDADASKWWIRIPVKTNPDEVKQDSIWSVDYATAIDGGLAFEGIPNWISIVR